MISPDSSVVEQWIEDPRVTSSTLVLGTLKRSIINLFICFVLKRFSSLQILLNAC